MTPTELLALVSELVRLQMRENEIRALILQIGTHAVGLDSPLEPEKPEKKVRQVRANGRPAAVLAMLRDAGAPVALEAIALRSEWTRAATSKVLSSMLSSGLVDRTADGDYILPE